MRCRVANTPSTAGPAGQVGMKKDVFQVSPEKLIEKFNEIVKDASVKPTLMGASAHLLCVGRRKQ